MTLACRLGLCRPWSPCPCRRRLRTGRSTPYYEPALDGWLPYADVTGGWL